MEMMDQAQPFAQQSADGFANFDEGNDDWMASTPAQPMDDMSSAVPMQPASSGIQIQAQNVIRSNAAFGDDDLTEEEQIIVAAAAAKQEELKRQLHDKMVDEQR